MVRCCVAPSHLPKREVRDSAQNDTPQLRGVRSAINGRWGTEEGDLDLSHGESRMSPDGRVRVVGSRLRHIGRFGAVVDTEPADWPLRRSEAWPLAG